MDDNILSKIKYSVCSINFTELTFDEMTKLDQEDSVKIKKHIQATGFAVSNSLILTNRHVIESLFMIYQRDKNMHKCHVEFNLKGENENQIKIHRFAIKGLAPLISGKGNLDIGFIELINKLDSKNIYPVEFGKLDDIRIGKEIGICGFPGGNELIDKIPGILRMGPILQKGIISALSPFESSNIRNIDTYIIDINSYPGMSGSPVFNYDNGNVIGVHYGGVPRSLGSVHPIDKKRVDDLILSMKKVYEAASKDPGNLKKQDIKLSDSGDLLDS